MPDGGDARRSGPLSAFRVLDVSRIRAGPAACRHFADWGADVIRIEAPEGMADDPLGALRHNFDFQNLHRNKRCITLNLREPDGLALFYQLVATADVVIENGRPEVKRRLKIDYDTLKMMNARLVYASISGFGQDGPYAKRPGYDQIAQGMGGLMSVTGEKDAPPMRAGVAMADLCAGHFAAMGVMTALLERERSGKGQCVATSLLQAQIAMMDFQASRYLIMDEPPERAGNDHPYLTPMGVYETADGCINIAVATEGQWRALCEVLGDDALAADDRFQSVFNRTANREACNAAVSALTKTFESLALVSALNKAGVPSGPIYDMRQVFDDPQVRHLGMATPVDHPEMGEIRLVSQPIEMSRSALEPFTPTPPRGAHTDEVLRELGCSTAEIETLRERRVV